LLRFLQEAGKEYRARVVVRRRDRPRSTRPAAVLERAEMSITRDQLEAAARAFVGDIEQVPPMVSALKVGGRRLYELARAGEEIERAARPVRIDELVVEHFEPACTRRRDQGRVYQRDLHPDARSGPRRLVGWMRAPRSVAPPARRQLHPGRRASDRGGGGRPGRGRARSDQAVRDLDACGSTRNGRAR